MAAGTPSIPGDDWDFWRNGLDRGFYNRMYKRSAQIAAVAALLFLVFDQRQIALGVLSGSAAGVFSLWTCEMTVRLLFQGGGFSGVKLAVGALVKMPLLLGALLGIAWASFHGYMNIFGVVGGVVMVHGVLLTQVIATAASQADKNTERFSRRRRGRQSDGS